ncbi:hypothetical protein ACIBG0_28855 [Nocardia sp. NPDC050630]|uniref:hypothetical protein n=1 Tax=Nocardia sp. NPDC050630 TaxID=3364321 RepID=UPI0037AE34F2
MTEPTHRSLLVLDVEDSESLSNVQLESMRSTLYRALDEAIPHPEVVVAKEDRGDGAMLVLGIPVLDVLDQIVEALLAGVQKHNNQVGPLDWLRVRIAVHEGYVGKDDNGWSSDALTATFRMNAAPAVKQVLKRAPRTHGVVVVSDVVYQGVVRHSYRATVTPNEYRSTVISMKNGDVRIWVRVPGYPEPPLPESDPAPAGSKSGGATPQADENNAVTANNLILGSVRARTIIGRDNIGGHV